MRIRAVAAIARHALLASLRSRYTAAGAAVLLLIALLGPVGFLVRDSAWSLDDGLLTIGFLAGALFMVRSGLVEQRIGGLDVFLRHNLATPLEHVAGLTLSLLATWVILGALTFGAILVLSPGNLHSAWWIPASLLLRWAPALPLTLVAERVSTLRVPFFFPAFGFLTLLVALALFAGPEALLALLGATPQRGQPATWLPLALRAGILTSLGFLAILAVTAWRAPPPAPVIATRDAAGMEG